MLCHFSPNMLKIFISQNAPTSRLYKKVFRELLKYIIHVLSLRSLLALFFLLSIARLVRRRALVKKISARTSLRVYFASTIFSATFEDQVGERYRTCIIAKIVPMTASQLLRWEYYYKEMKQCATSLH